MRANQIINWNKIGLTNGRHKGKKENKANLVIKEEVKEIDCVNSIEGSSHITKDESYDVVLENKDYETDIDDESEEENNEITRFSIEAMNKTINESNKFNDDSSDLIKNMNNNLIEMRDKGLKVEARVRYFYSIFTIS